MAIRQTWQVTSLAVGHLDDLVLVVAADAGDLLGEEFGAEAIRLKESALGQFVSAETLGEAEVVFDLGAGAGLPADCFGLDDQRAAGPRRRRRRLQRGRRARRRRRRRRRTSAAPGCGMPSLLARSLEVGWTSAVPSPKRTTGSLESSSPCSLSRSTASGCCSGFSHW